MYPEGWLFCLAWMLDSTLFTECNSHHSVTCPRLNHGIVRDALWYSNPVLPAAGRGVKSLGNLAWPILTMKTVIGIALAIGLLAAACQQNGSRSLDEVEDPANHENQADETTGPLSTAVVNRIVFVGSSGSLFTVNPDGSDLFNLTGGAQVASESRGGVLAQPEGATSNYFWPTWSPDGTRIAASKVVASDGRPEVSVDVFDLVGRGVRNVYVNPVPSVIAQGAPHYLYWSPDSRTLSVLVSAPEAFALLALDTQALWKVDEITPDVVETGAPLYYHWNQDGNAILIHSRDELRVARRPFQIVGGGGTTVGFGFRTPAFSPDGTRMAFAVQNPDTAGAALFVEEVGHPGTAASILEVASLAAFAWSPDGSELAVVDQEGGGSPLFQRLILVPAGGGEVRTLAQEPIAAFFWAPGGDKIAWVGVDAQDQLLELKVSPVRGGGVQELLRFHPSNDTMTMLNFFDQYSYSHSLWSPDGNWLVLAGTREEPYQRRNGGSPSGERVFILDASGATGPRELAQGSLGVWSWN